MSHPELLALLVRARRALDQFLVEEDVGVMRDDVAQICMDIDDALPDESRISIKSATPLTRTLDEVAA